MEFEVSVFDWHLRDMLLKKKMLEMLELLIVKSQFVLDDMELDIRHGIE